ncbi:MAG TPA: T9SS type A sorting domain-containing protein [bacterium]|nr:T9SS type A sorting domain-containing protein [bacterium]
MKKMWLLVCWGIARFAFAGDMPRTLFIENNLARTLSTVNLETGAVHNDVATLGQIPNQILAYRDKVLALNSVPPEIMIIDASSLQVEKRVALPEGSNPYGMALVGANRVYVTLLLMDAVAVVEIREGRVAKLIPCGRAPQGIIVDGTTALVANTGGYPDYQPSTVAFIDIARDSLLTSVAVPANPQVVRKGPDWNYYVLCSGIWGGNSGQLAVINPYAPPDYAGPAVVDTLVVGGYPGDLAVLPDGMAYICDWGDHTGGFLYKVNIYSGEILHNARNPLRVGRGAMHLLWDKKNAELYISAFDQDVVQKFDVQQDRVVMTYPAGDGSQDMAIVERSDSSDPWADEVVAFSPGQPWSKIGYDFFPDNVLGPPDPDRGLNSASTTSDPAEILSLGHGGEITLAFTDNVVVDGPGVDFIIFENVFMNLWTGQPFMEAATVAVSQDGNRFVDFPYDTSSCVGLAGCHVVQSTSHPLDPQRSGADQFDLADVGMDWIRYVRITDMGDRWQEGAINGDFDLDAVVAVNSRTSISCPQAKRSPQEFNLAANYPNPFNSSTTIFFTTAAPGRAKLTVINLLGQSVATLLDQNMPAGFHRVIWDGSDGSGKAMNTGLYWAVLQFGDSVQRQKMVLVK